MATDLYCDIGQSASGQGRVQDESKSILSVDETKGLPCQTYCDADSHAAKRMECSNQGLPEDIWSCIHSLMPTREAARVACLSNSFLRSWRYHPILILNADTFGLKYRRSHRRHFNQNVDRILSKHTGIGVKIFKLEYLRIWEYYAGSYLESWLQVAVKPGIEEITLMLCKTTREYNFPCSLLSDGVGSSLRHLKLCCCALHPTGDIGPLRNLTTLQLSDVSITGDELEGLLYKSLALEELDVNNCEKITSVKIPCTLQRFSSLRVFNCWRLKKIASKAPNLSSFRFGGGGPKLKLSLGETLRMKKLHMQRSNYICYARTNLPSRMPNLVTLSIQSNHEVVNTPMLPTKFLYLKHLYISLASGSISFPSYDYLSLVSFIEASPSLETFTLCDVKVHHAVTEYESIFSNPSDLRQVPEHPHGHLKSVTIKGFTSAKSLVELTCYILKNAVSLECITLDTFCYSRDHPKTQCLPMRDMIITEAPRALSAIRTYIEDKIPHSVKLTVLEPCSQCHFLRGF